MADQPGDPAGAALKLDFDSRLRLRFRGSVITSDGGLPAYRELDNAVGWTDMAGDVLADARTGKNGRHALVGLLWQSMFGRLAGYADVNDAERLCRDPAMRWVVGDRVVREAAASASEMGRFETEWLTRPENLASLANLSGQWVDRVHRRRPLKLIVLDRDLSESRSTANRRGATTTATSSAPAITRCSCSTSSATWNGARCGPAMFTVPLNGSAYCAR